MATRNALYTPLTLAVLALVIGPIGIAVFVLGFVLGDSPCVLCWAQRTGMVLIALTGLFVVRFGPRPRYIGLAVLQAGFGLYMGLRHSSLHLWRDVGQGFSAEILGAHTYTWSMFIYWAAVVMMGVLLLMLKDGEAAGEARRLRPLGRVTLWLFLAGGRRQCRPGVRQHRAAAIHGAGRPGPLLVQPRQLGVVARGVAAVPGFAPRPLGDRETGRRPGEHRPGREPPGERAGAARRPPRERRASAGRPHHRPGVRRRRRQVPGDDGEGDLHHGRCARPGAAAHGGRHDVLGGPRALRCGSVPRQRHDSRGVREQELRRPPRERQGRRRRELPLLPGVVSTSSTR